jgi:hypothetical protein
VTSEAVARCHSKKTAVRIVGISQYAYFNSIPRI